MRRTRRESVHCKGRRGPPTRGLCALGFNLCDHERNAFEHCRGAAIAVDRSALGRPGDRLRRLVPAAVGPCLPRAVQHRQSVGRDVLHAGAGRELPALHGDGLPGLWPRRHGPAPAVHGVGHAGSDRARRPRAPPGLADSVPVHPLRVLEPVALHRAELRLAADVCQAWRPRSDRHHATQPAYRLRGVLRHAARRLQRRRRLRSAGAVTGIAIRDHPQHRCDRPVRSSPSPAGRRSLRSRADRRGGRSSRR